MAVKLPLFEILFSGEVHPPSVPQTIIPKTFAVSTEMIPVLPLVDPVKTTRNKRRANTSSALGKLGDVFSFLLLFTELFLQVKSARERIIIQALLKIRDKATTVMNLTTRKSEAMTKTLTKYTPTMKRTYLLKTCLVAVSFLLSLVCVHLPFIFHSLGIEEELTDDEPDEGWITKKRNFEISKNHNSAVLYINRTFTFTSSNCVPEDKFGKIVDVVAPVDDRKNLHFKYYNPEMERREKNYKYISCRELLQKDAVKWDIPQRDLTGKGLIGRRVQSLFQVGEVFFWYEGRVMNYNSNDKQFLIRYCDNEVSKVKLTHLLPMLRRGKPVF